MSPGSSTESYPAFARIGLRENPGKTSTRRNADNNGTRSTGVRKKASGDKKRNQESGSDREESSEKIKGASVSGNLGCGSESVGRNKRGIEEEEGNKKKDRDRNKAETSSKERSLPSKKTLRGHSDSSFRGEGYIQCCVGVRLCDMYSNQELAAIRFMYGKADGNAALARRLYQERGRPRSTTPEVQEEILEAVKMTPSISTRRMALQVEFYLWGHLKSLVYSSLVPDWNPFGIELWHVLRTYAILLEFGIVFAGQCEGAETRTLRRSEEKGIQAFAMWIWRSMERVKWTDRIRNEAVLERFQRSNHSNQECKMRSAARHLDVNGVILKKILSTGDVRFFIFQ
ncbi:hypothetical protein ANN_00728 [Periplaneta americana]|uniref:DUF4817 domain-containing protein n=1 Tax=Periplaneta americana TaxID=6978 RepID=A0ABQ8TUI9_PERAM|nr:hypothetical protein ANN_00728 [Periplaneta americana]